jgi:hypothetical protein
VIIAGLAVSFWKELIADTRASRDALAQFIAQPPTTDAQK